MGCWLAAKHGIINKLVRFHSITGFTILVCATFILMGIIVPWLLFVNSHGELSANVLLMFCIIIWCQLRLAYAELIGQKRLTLLCFYAFVYVFFGVQPLISVSTHVFPNNINLPDNLITFTNLLVILGIVAFEVGYVVGRKKIDTAISYKNSSKVLSLRMIWYASAVVGGLTVLVMLYYGPGTFIGLREYGGDTVFWTREVVYTELVLVVYGVRVLAAILLFFTVHLWKVYKCSTLPSCQIRSLRFALLLLSVLNLVVSNPLAAPRLWAGTLLLTVLFISMRWRGIHSFLVLNTIACISLLTLFSGIDSRHFSALLARNEVITTATVGLLVNNAIRGLNTDANFDAFAMLAATTQYTDNYGYSCGRQLLLPGFFWVPRFIWSSKPIGTPDMVADFINLENLNVSCPLLAEGYVNFGIFGLLMFLFLFGWLARAGDDFQTQTASKPGSAFQTVISSYFTANTFILLRGDLTSGTMYLQLVVAISFLISYLNRCFRKDKTCV